MEKRKYSPQEKKDLSYRKDRRNAYGENNKSSRKNIPRSKALSIRSERHARNQALHSALIAPTEDQQVATENRVHTASPRRWRKSPDVPLSEHVARQRKRR